MGIMVTFKDADFSSNAIPEVYSKLLVNKWMKPDGAIEAFSDRYLSYISADSGDAIVMNVGSKGTFYAFVTSVAIGNNLVSGTSRTSLTANSQATVNVPEGTKYVVFSRLSTDGDYSPVSATINGKDIVFTEITL